MRLLPYILILGIYTCKAQSFGFRLGPSFVNQSLRNGGVILRPGVAARFHAGAFVNSAISKEASVQVELGYSVPRP
ncbi:MAG: hypothetical protein KF775_09025 [Cyclobacteriaceae bacterium]|nr:hypothetical protein [Cyclobacteriaceae bacterium]